MAVTPSALTVPWTRRSVNGPAWTRAGTRPVQVERVRSEVAGAVLGAQEGAATGANGEAEGGPTGAAEAGGDLLVRVEEPCDLEAAVGEGVLR